MIKIKHRILLVLLLLVITFLIFSQGAKVYARENPLQWFENALILIFGGYQGGEVPDITPIPDDVHNSGTLPGTTLAPGSYPYVSGPLSFTPPSGYKYFSQCSSEFGGLPLPNCPSKTLCNAGCGPTTVAMIIASLANSSYTPARALKDYQDNNLPVTCYGTYTGHAKKVLELNNIRTTPDRDYNYESVNNKIATDFKSWLDKGVTIFALADYCENGCGHFFWIVDIDNNGNVWAYDPYYGRREAPPINENRYSPFPRYRSAFGVSRK